MSKIAKENANFVESLGEVFDLMADALPEKERELFKAAADEVKPGLKEAAEELRSGVHDEALAVRKPPALWEFEKQMYNDAAAEVGAPLIEEEDDDVS